MHSKTQLVGAPTQIAELNDVKTFAADDGSIELLEDVALRNLIGVVDHPEWMRWQPAAARTLVHPPTPLPASAAHRAGRAKRNSP